MRAFHLSWFAFFLCFFGWFGIAPLMKVVADELSLTPEQIGNCIIASVTITIFARIIIGCLCDRFGPRLCYTWLLILGSIPVMGIGLAQSYESFLIFRLAIGAIGASFVITQYHTSVMFASNCVGTANATTAGWGILGGGVTQIAMPLLLAGLLTVGVGEFWGWRLSMVVAGVICLLTGIAYYTLTQDTPAGNFKELRARGELPPAKQSRGSLGEAIKDYRVWSLAVIYGACFGMELTICNVGAMYFADNFALGIFTAGLIVGLYGLMSIFARSLGGYASDRADIRWGLRGRVHVLFFVLFASGLALILFSRLTVLWFAVPGLIVFGIFQKMATGATFAVVPFVNKRALGAVVGLVGAGGNAGAVAAGFLFRTESTWWPMALLILGIVIACCSLLALTLRFSPETSHQGQTVARGHRHKYEHKHKHKHKNNLVVEAVLVSNRVP